MAICGLPTTTGLPVPPSGPAAPTANAYTAASNRNANSTYDAAGDLTVFGAASVTYDAENRQKASGANSYLYDGLGQRVEKVLSSGTTVYVYDAFSELVAEYGATVVTAPCTTCYLSYDQHSAGDGRQCECDLAARLCAVWARDSGGPGWANDIVGRDG